MPLLFEQKQKTGSPTRTAGGNPKDLLLVLVNHFLQFFARNELGYIGGGDVHGAFGLRIDPGAALTGGDLKRAEADQPDFFALPKGGLDDVDGGLKSLVGLGLSQIGSLGDFPYEFDLFHLLDPPVKFEIEIQRTIQGSYQAKTSLSRG